MSYLLNASTIRAPHTFSEANSTMYAQQRTLDGTVSRDYFGDNKKVWVLEYNNTKKTDYDTINAIYQTYLSSATPVAWQVTETNYTVSATTVHIDLKDRGFSIRGSDYLSDFTLTLTEA